MAHLVGDKELPQKGGASTWNNVLLFAAAVSVPPSVHF